jgi:hypothetical protein
MALATGAEAKPSRWLHQPYARVRAALLQRGYRPAKLDHPQWLCEQTGLCGRYPEVSDCAGTGESVCSFVFLQPDRRSYLMVFTIGEIRLTVDAVRRALPSDMARLRDYGSAGSTLPRRSGR